MIRRTRSSLTVLIVAALATGIATAGCGRAAGPPGTIQVTGTVTHEGQPLPTGAVHFVAADGGGGGRGGATRIAGGRFRLFLTPGRYRLAVVATDGVETIDPKSGGPVPGKSLIPARYANVETSGLEATVDAGHRTVECVLSR